MRLLLDEGFPPPPGFRINSVDKTVEIVTLREFEPSLTNSSTPDWYIYLRADEAGFGAFVTQDWHQSEQIEELWTLSQTTLSLIKWQKSSRDPIQEWGQLLAYLPEIQRMIKENGPSIIFLPSPRLSRNNIKKATAILGQFASNSDISNQRIQHQARQIVENELLNRNELDRYKNWL